ncbi:MAG: GAF domain-containing protein [Firmicutes bacterium]|jgi:L-methionine (R)-S-oxide reductase|nr:GAF domain-containing protein [Bacillota bacterium]
MEKAVFYRELCAKLEALIGEERDWLANLANTAALLYQELPRINWVGFYLLKGDELVLGPFQGKPACIRIAMGKGVCGQTALHRKAHVVPDVHEFAGHIVCDPASRSEVVVPLEYAGRLIGVLDIDSPELARFDSADADGLTEVAKILVERCLWE